MHPLAQRSELPASGLSGSIADTNYHAVATKTFEDYPRLYRADLEQNLKSAWAGVAWRGDQVAGQAVLWTNAATAHGVRVTVSDLRDGRGNVIHAGNVQTNFLKYTLAGRGNPSFGNPSEPIPDILDDTERVSIVEGGLQPVWFTIAVPQDTVAGLYEGRLTAVDESGTEVDFELALEVLDIVLPGHHVRFLDLWQNPYAVARAAGIQAERLWSDEHFESMRSHYVRLRDAGQKVITTTIVRDPWDSQTLDIYESMVAWTRLRSGRFEFDFSVFDAWVEFMLGLGINDQIDAYGMVSWAGTVTYLDEETGKTVVRDVVTGSPEWAGMWRQFLLSFVEHLSAKGWLAFTFMAMDERSLDDVFAATELIEEVSNSKLRITAAMNYNSISDPRLDRIHNISVLHDKISLAGSEFESVASHRRSLGLNTTLYNCVGNFPNSFTRSNPAEGVWMQWKAVRVRADGYLRWAFDSFNEDPDVSTDYLRWESGDSFLVYPRNRSSVRFEKIKEGLRDAEKVAYLSGIDRRTEQKLRRLLMTMRDEGVAFDQFGGVIDPGIVDIPSEVKRLQDGLLAVTRRVIADSNEMKGKRLTL